MGTFSQRPGNWKDLPETKKFLKTLEKKLKGRNILLLKSTKGSLRRHLRSLAGRPGLREVFVTRIPHLVQTNSSRNTSTRQRDPEKKVKKGIELSIAKWKT